MRRVCASIPCSYGNRRKIRMDNTENRLIRLEEKLYFQEKMVDDLNEALTLQQK